MRARSAFPPSIALLLLASALGCGGDVEPPPSVAADAPEPTTADAGASPDAGALAPPSTTCCRLDNERGERLDYKCGLTGTAISVEWFEARDYRCWLVR